MKTTPAELEERLKADRLQKYMMDCQKTISKPISFSGIGVHTGNRSAVTFRPAPENFGIRFRRIDLPGVPEVPASIDKVSGTMRGTTISEGDVKVHTVEHVLAALVAFGIDNLIIEMDSNEPPVGDGSALPFVEMIQKGGVQNQNAPKKELVIREPIWVNEPDVTLVALPYSHFRVSYTVLFPQNRVGLDSQYLDIEVNQDQFVEEIAPARTFCFFREVEALMDQGLIKGGSLENAVVIGDEAILSKEKLRFPNEFVRHKVLDIIGDLSLLGSRLRAHVIAIRSGHQHNIKLARALSNYAKKIEAQTLPFGFGPGDGAKVLNINEIKKILPHRYPFLLVDRILDIEEDKKIIGIKNVTANEEFFNGHFPQQPVMPGVLIIEAIAQVAGVMMLRKVENQGRLAYFTNIDNARFRRMVVPGDQLRLEVELVKVRSRVGKVHGVAYVGTEVAAEADLMFAIGE